MAKEAGDLWDDSALINAFDNAISKYKIMHRKGYNNSLTEGGKVITSTGENVSNHGESHEAKRHIEADEADDNSNVASNTATDLGETNNLSPIKENHCLDSCAPEPYMDSSNGPHMQNVLKGYSNSQGAEDYTELLNQYYELEEQRQKILQQLHQLGSWNYQSSGEGSGFGVQCGSCSTSNQASHPTFGYSCCPYVCQCLVAPCTSLPACTFGGTCAGKSCTDATAAVGPGKSFPLEDGDIVKTAMGAAERAISSMKTTVTGNSNVNEEKEKNEGKNEGEMAQSTSSETDIAVVLNAWYSAGFYTGKYLTEQSVAKKRHG